jgi:transcription initiation factor IIE alpha subunit
MKAKGTRYYLFHSGDSREIEDRINDLLEKNPDSDVEFLKFKVADKYVKETFYSCQSCGNPLSQSRNPALPFICHACKRGTTEQDASKSIQIKYVRAGNVLIQPIILRGP